MKSREKRNAKKRRILHNAFTLLQLLSVFAALASYYLRFCAPHPWTADRLLGAAICVPSFFLWCCARLDLGVSFTLAPEARGLVTSGLYKYFSNPIYVFSALAMFGYILLVRRPAWLLSLALLGCVQAYRARQEARALLSEFGDEYTKYLDSVIV